MGVLRSKGTAAGRPSRAERPARRVPWVQVVFFGVAALLFALTFWLVASGIAGSLRAGAASAWVRAQLEERLPVPDSAPVAEPVPTKDVMPAERVDGRDYIAILGVPALGLELPVAAQADEATLRISPGRYAGSYGGDDLVVCGQGYASHFGRLSALGISDEVRLVTVDGQSLHYIVSNVENDRLEEIDAIMDDWDLSLFTFNMDGTCLVVRCVRSA